MAPDLLIIGEQREREELARRVVALGYRALGAAPRELRRYLDEEPPAAILLSARGADVSALLAALRRDPRGLGIPVILYSELGGAIRDLADVLELGADRFLVAPVDDDELLAALVEVLGPSEPAAPEVPADPATGELPLRQRDPLLAQLRRTLAALDERGEPAAGEDGLDDLDAIGLGGADELGELGPLESDGAPPLSPLALLDVEPATRRLGGAGPSAGAPIATLRLEGEGERAPAPALEATTMTRRRTRPGEAGALADEPAPALLARLARDRFSGRLELAGPATIEIWWRQGAPIDALSDRPRDRLGAALRRRGLVDAAAASELDRRLPADLGAAIDVLVADGHLKPGEAARVLDEHLAELLTAAFPWEEGAWSLDPGARRSAGVGLRRPLAEVLLEGALIELEEPLLRRRLGDEERCPRARADAPIEGLAPPAGLGDPRGLLDGRHRLVDLAALGGQPLLAWVATLAALAWIDLVDQPADDQAAIDRRRIRGRHAAAVEGDYFGLLDLPITASRGEIRRAVLELGRTFGDASLELTTRAELAGELAELRAGLSEARDVLLDDGLRAAYLAHREGEQ